MKYLYRIGGWLAFVLILLQVLVGLISWILTAAMPETFVHSLSSPEGIRWFFGSFVDNLASPLLVWILLAAVAYGTLHESGLLRFDHSEYRQRIALRLVLLELVLLVVVILMLTMVPQAILLNVTGGLMDSSFSRSIIPYICFSVIVMSISFGLMSDKFKGVEGVFRAASCGIAMAAPLMIIYLLVVQLYYSILYLI